MALAKGDPIQSPYVMTFGDYRYDQASADPARPDHAVQVSITFNNTTRVITGATVWRAANCLWTKIVVGLGTDNIPDHTDRFFDLSKLSDASQAVPVQQLNRAPWNIDTIEDLLNVGQITAAL